MTWPTYSKALRRDVDALLRKGGTLSAYRSSSAFPDWIAPKAGSQAFLFERELEKAFNVKHAIGMNSGTMALTAAIKALDLPKGSGIVTTPYTFSGTSAAIILAGHFPQYADIDDTTFNITADAVERVITKKTGAIVPVDLFGQLCDYDGLRTFDLPVVADGCQSVGAAKDGQFHFADITCGSGNGSKNCPGGEIGWALTNKKKYAARMRRYISHGENFEDKEVGVNGRLQECVALIGRHGLSELIKRNHQRHLLAETVTTALWNFPFVSQLPKHMSCLKDGSEQEHVWYVYPFTQNIIDRADFVKRMKKRGYAIQEGYTAPLHTLPAFKRFATKPLPVVEEVHRRLCLLTTLTPDKPLSYAKKVAKAIKECLA